MKYLTIVLASLFLSTASYAQQAVCTDYENIVTAFGKLGEVLIWQGQMDNKTFEVWGKPNKDHSWTIIVKRDGMACVAAMGEGWVSPQKGI